MRGEDGSEDSKSSHQKLVKHLKEDNIQLNLLKQTPLQHHLGIHLKGVSPLKRVITIVLMHG